MILFAKSSSLEETTVRNTPYDPLSVTGHTPDWIILACWRKKEGGGESFA